MKKLLLLAAALFCLATARAEAPGKVTFAFITDTHIGAFPDAETDMRLAVADMNQHPEIDFVIHAGDASEFGVRAEMELVKNILDGLNKPYFIVPGNHETNWSENGCTEFPRLFGSTHFAHRQGGYLFVGCGSGPALRMGPPQIPTEELHWLDSTLQSADPAMPVIFVNHLPADGNLANRDELLDILKRHNIVAILGGHVHANTIKNYDGIPGMTGRSNLRRKDPLGGYNLVTVEDGKMTWRERTPFITTKPAWAEIELKDYDAAGDTAHYPRPDYTVNDRYPQVKVLWKTRDVTDVAAQAELSDDLFLYANTEGVVRAVRAKNGREAWSYRTGNKVFGAPFVAVDAVVAASADGFVYCLNRKDGKLRWKFDTQAPVVSAPLVCDGTVYLGNSGGQFFALSLADGQPVWESAGLKGYIEARALADSDRIYIGTWGAMFYALNRHDGRKVWEFDTGKGRYFSPGACWPVMADGKVTVLSSDYFVRAFDPATGQVVWASDEAKGRESLGISEDGQTIYVKSITDHLDAASVAGGRYQKLWSVKLPHRSDFAPTTIKTQDGLVFVPTEFGTVYAVDASGKGIVWAHKPAHSAVTSLNPAPGRRLFVTHMNGTVACLRY